MIWVDYLSIAIFLTLSILIPFYFTKRKNSVREYFQSEGKLSWFIAGTGMVATTFAADTPLAVTELVALYGISGNWIWWYGAIGSVVTVYFFAPLWKRSGVLTDLELISLRYSSDLSLKLRKFKAIYLGFFMNILVLAWVNLAMMKISEVLIPEIDPKIVVTTLFLFAFLYTALLGLTGISYADAFQFFYAMTICIIIAILAINLPEIGGVAGLKGKLPNHAFNLLPDFQSSGKLGLMSFLMMILVTWWASWYPGAEPGGGGYIAQRIMASKDVKSSIYSSLYFTFAHYFLRPWPWIITALCALVLFPNLSEADKGKGFILIVQKVLPTGFSGIFISAFLAAYLSTIATHLNWGTSYIINDFIYQKDNDQIDKNFLRYSYSTQLIIMAFSLPITFYLIQSISQVWIFLLECGAGAGFVLMARWYWWRINVYSELAAMIAPPLFYLIGKYLLLLQFPHGMLFTVTMTVQTIILVTLFTKSEPVRLLQNFYHLTKPPGWLWEKWATKNNIPIIIQNVSIGRLLASCAISLILLFSSLFSLGSIILGDYLNAGILGALSIASTLILIQIFPDLN